LFGGASERLYRWVGRNSGCVFSNNVAKHGWLRWLEKQCKALFFFDIVAHPPLHLRAWHHDWMSKFNFYTWCSRFRVSAV
jgi:hypothetical protein